MRVALFTDTLGDVNGVSRFIQNIAHQARLHGRDLRVITSTRFQTPREPNIHNFKPDFATAMPKYPQLEVVWPPARTMTRFARDFNPDVVHVSTPGPVGSAGRRFARRHNLPILGVYHTDFPAYVDHLFDDRALTWVCASAMRRFYKPFASIFTRSDDYAESLVRLGIPRSRLLRLRPGIDLDLFSQRHHDPTIWNRITGHNIPQESLKAIYVGRVSVEKNLPFLAKLWPRIHATARARGIDARLIVIGDGPYRSTMQSLLHDHGAHFLGFRHGLELATLYASSHLFLFPSTTDTLGQVVMEAQASGLPVIVTDQGGPKEVVRHQHSGLVLSATDVAGWTRSAVELLTNHDLRARMSESAHADMQPFSIRHSFEHFWDEHERALHQARSRTASA